MKTLAIILSTCVLCLLSLGIASASGVLTIAVNTSDPAVSLQNDGTGPALRVQDSTGPRVDLFSSGGAAGGSRLYLPKGDILNVRNIQGGVVGDLNLDIGAGSAQDRGDVAFNYDVGQATLAYDGSENLILGVNQNGSGETRVHSGLSLDTESTVATPASGATLFLSAIGKLSLKFSDGTVSTLQTCN